VTDVNVEVFHQALRKRVQKLPLNRSMFCVEVVAAMTLVTATQYLPDGEYRF
jgi:hypothetical protein